MNNWIRITAKFDSSCFECGESISIGELVYWRQFYGTKHYPQCITDSQEDDTRLIIQEADEDFYLK